MRCAKLSPAFAILFVTLVATGQSYMVRTLAGGGLPDNVPATQVALNSASHIASDSAGNLYIAGLFSVMRMDAATGLLRPFAGTGVAGFTGDGGPAINAQFSSIAGLAVDAAGNVYISDIGDNRVRRVSNGIITTIAGNGQLGFSGDGGPATLAQVTLSGIAVGPEGNLYIAADARIRRVSRGIISTILGDGIEGDSGDDGPAVNARIGVYAPLMAADAAGSVYVIDGNHYRIRKITNGIVTAFAGNGTQGSTGDGGAATRAGLSQPLGVAADSFGNVFLSEEGRIRMVKDGVISTVAGTGSSGFTGDNGPAANAQVSNSASGLAVDAADNLYVSDGGNFRVRKISAGTITTVAGNGSSSGGFVDNASGDAQFARICAAAIDAAGSTYVADCAREQVRKISNGLITTVAGDGNAGYGGDNGPATNAMVNLQGPLIYGGLAVESAGAIYIADTNNARVRKVSNGIITTVVGNGTAGFSGDGGAATNAQLSQPTSLAVDSTGNLYIGDKGNARIRKVANGVITTFAGGGTGGYEGLATDAQLTGRDWVAVDSRGTVSIFDGAAPCPHHQPCNNKSLVLQVAGGRMSISPNPWGTIDAAGNIFSVVGASVQKTTGGITNTIAGIGTHGFSGDNGPALNAQFMFPLPEAVDSDGNIYLIDGDRLRVLSPIPSNCTYAVGTTTLQALSAGGEMPVSIQTGDGCPWIVTGIGDGLPGWITVTGTAYGKGAGTVRLTAAVNAGARRNSTISIAGTPVSIAQLAATGPIGFAATPVALIRGAARGQTTLNWSAPGYDAVQIFVAGKMIAADLPTSGSFDTEKTVTNGTVFTLVDQASGASMATVTTTTIRGFGPVCRRCR